MEPSYTSPPILEAVIEFRFADKTENRNLEKFVSKIRKKYFKKDEEHQHTWETQFQGSDFTQKHSSRPLGFRMTSEDGADILVIHTNRLVFSRLAPYPGWLDFTERARRECDIWRASVGPAKIERLGVRFINRIDIPEESAAEVNPSDYVTVFPSIPQIGPDGVDDYKMQITKPLIPGRINMTITSGSIQSPVPGAASILLDIDVYTNESNLLVSKIWDSIDEIRTLKNAVFESCITEKSRELFSK